MILHQPNKPPGHVTVAAYNSDPRWRENADYVCDGHADEVEIQHALDHFSDVKLDTHGTYRCTQRLELRCREPESDAARLSRLLWYARETADMYADIVEARTSKNDSSSRELRDEIDLYREEQGWSPNGFGGEDDEPLQGGTP